MSGTRWRVVRSDSHESKGVSRGPGTYRLCTANTGEKTYCVNITIHPRSELLAEPD